MRVVNSSNTPSFDRHYTTINHENSLYLVHTYGTIIIHEFLILPNDGRQVPLSFTKKKQHSDVKEFDIFMKTALSSLPL